MPEPVGEFEETVQPIFNRQCLECHSSQNAVRRLALNSWESLLMGSENDAMIIPFHPKVSHLFQYLHTDTTLSPVAPPLIAHRQKSALEQRSDGNLQLDSERRTKSQWQSAV
ncbi:MAG: c-type cytochrome domain-containing protein [Chlorobiales bacterium]